MLTILTGIRSMQSRDAESGAVPKDTSIRRNFGDESRTGRFPRQVQSANGSPNQLLDVRLAFRIGYRQGAGGAIAEQGLGFSPKLGIEIAARQLKKWIRGIFVAKRTDDRKRPLVLLIVTMQVHGEIKAGHARGENALRYGMFEQPDALLLRAAGNTHEEAQDSCDAAEGVHIVVVKAESEVGVSQAGIKNLGAKKVFPSTNAKTGGIAIFPAQAVKACRRGVCHARVELHFRGFALLKVGGSERGGFGGQIKVVLVGGEFRAAASVAHSVLVFGRNTPGAPPERFCLEKISKRMIGVFYLHLLGGFSCAFKIKGIDLLENGRRLRRQRQICGAGLATETHQEKKTNGVGIETSRQGKHHVRPEKFCAKPGLRWMSLSCSRRVANQNGFFLQKGVCS